MSLAAGPWDRLYASAFEKEGVGKMWTVDVGDSFPASSSGDIEFDIATWILESGNGHVTAAFLSPTTHPCLIFTISTDDPQDQTSTSVS